MKRYARRVLVLLFLGLGLVCGVLNGAITDYFRSATGVFSWHKTTAINESREEIDIRSDKTYVWTFRSRVTYPGVVPNQSEFSRRGKWKSSGAAVSLFIGDGPDRVSFEFTMDDGDLIEKAGLKRRFARKVP